MWFGVWLMYHYYAVLITYTHISTIRNTFLRVMDCRNWRICAMMQIILCFVGSQPREETAFEGRVNYTIPLVAFFFFYLYFHISILGYWYIFLEYLWKFYSRDQNEYKSYIYKNFDYLFYFLIKLKKKNYFCIYFNL